MTRLDVYLTEKGLSRSRSEAKALISGGCVIVDGKVITKPAYEVSEDTLGASVDRSGIKYASRGGLKLEGALEKFHVDVKGRKCLDVGASSGGFTDCLLQHGACAVIAVDSGRDQLAENLKNDARVINIEGYNARAIKREDLPFVPSLAVMDVSFISVTLILGALYEVLEDNGELVCLIKPQFEVGRSGIGKGGIVKDDKLRQGAVNRVVEFACSLGFTHLNTTVSPITGGDGNIEFLAHFKKSGREADGE